MSESKDQSIYSQCIYSARNQTSKAKDMLIQQLSSSIFSPQSESSEIALRPKKRLFRDNSSEELSHGIKRVDTPTNLMLRPTDHSAEDLFGSFNNEIKQKKSTFLGQSASRESLLDKEKSIKKVVKCTPMLHLKKNDSPSKPPLVAPSHDRKTLTEAKIRDLTPNFYPKPEDTKVQEIQIKGLKPNDDELSIKQMCQGLHFIDISPVYDNVTGNCSGTANIKLRTHAKTPDIEKVKKSFADKGLEAISVTPQRGKKNNYLQSHIGFLDSSLQQEEKRLNANNLTSSERKRALLGTSDDLFGNSPGTGKWEGQKNDNPEIKEVRKATENLKKWDSYKHLNTKSPITGSKIYAGGYSRPTISSRKKEIAYKE
ncbi:hypothetical protein SteCoe_6475 [Stentor coeruleus]|uniref:Uncharacterized protein n=1 Tax=Stentor coeruleus TaxID=5963 RepID=A0A1R2CPU5_9CILI|nr:hypothetical protein SteCoe_6475 [Stentor coeruleus]